MTLLQLIGGHIRVAMMDVMVFNPVEEGFQQQRDFQEGAAFYSRP